MQPLPSFCENPCRAHYDVSVRLSEPKPPPQHPILETLRVDIRRNFASLFAWAIIPLPSPRLEDIPKTIFAHRRGDRRERQNREGKGMYFQSPARRKQKPWLENNILIEHTAQNSADFKLNAIKPTSTNHPAILMAKTVAMDHHMLHLNSASDRLPLLIKTQQHQLARSTDTES